MSHIVVEDLSKLTNVGTIISDQLAAKVGAVMTVLPVDTSMLSGVGGFTKREFGHGNELHSSHARPVAQLALYLREGSHTVHWRACVKHEGRDEKFHHGNLRLVSDTSQGLPTCGVAPQGSFELAQLTHDMRQNNAWVIGGRSEARVTQPGVFGFALYGFGAGFRVVWAALSQE